MMNRYFKQEGEIYLQDHPQTYKKLAFNFKKNKEQDNGPDLDIISQRFNYEDCADVYWNPEKFSLLYGTKLWEQSSPSQRVKLNQIYWVAYYSQIISAEIATIFFNQTSAAGLFGMEDFRMVCDTLDLESAQERAHINAFKTVGEQFEAKVFGERIFTYPMRTPYADTMVFSQTNAIKSFWRNLQLRSFTLLSSGNAFIGCQYFTVRGIRTLNGKLVQHQLGQYHMKHPQKEMSPIPAQISYFHFLDESFHFNSSNIIGTDILQLLKPPTAFEKWVANQSLQGTQRDHTQISTAINGLFWYDPALYKAVYKVLRSSIFSMDHREALQMMEACFTQDSEGTQESWKSRNLALNSYQEYLDGLSHIDEVNRKMLLMKRNSLPLHLETNRREFNKFKRGLGENEYKLPQSITHTSHTSGADQSL